MVINEKASETYKFPILQFTFFSLEFAGTVFVGIVFVIFIILSTVLVLEYFSFSQVHVPGFQNYLFRTLDVFSDFCPHIDIYCYSTFYLNYILYYQFYSNLHLYFHDICFVNVFN